LFGNAVAPAIREVWGADSNKVSDLAISSELGGQELKSECMRKVTFRGTIVLDGKTWKLHPTKKDLWRTTKTRGDTNGPPLSWVRIDVLRRSRFTPGFKSVSKGVGRIPKKNGAGYFDFDVNLPNVAGEYLLVAYLVDTEDSQKKAHSEKNENFLFVRKIELVPFVPRKGNETQLFRSGA